jgi:hypothetical protein
MLKSLAGILGLALMAACPEYNETIIEGSDCDPGQIDSGPETVDGGPADAGVCPPKPDASTECHFHWVYQHCPGDTNIIGYCDEAVPDECECDPYTQQNCILICNPHTNPCCACDVEPPDGPGSCGGEVPAMTCNAWRDGGAPKRTDAGVCP